MEGETPHTPSPVYKTMPQNDVKNYDFYLPLVDSLVSSAYSYMALCVVLYITAVIISLAWDPPLLHDLLLPFGNEYIFSIVSQMSNKKKKPVGGESTLHVVGSDCIAWERHHHYHRNHRGAAGASENWVGQG